MELNSEMAKIKERQRQRFLGTLVTNNFLQENIQTVENWGLKDHYTKARQSLNHDRALEAVQRKEDLDLEHHKRKVFLVNKWSIIRERRRVYQERMLILNQKQERNFTWHNLINTNEIVRTIYAKFADVRWHTRLNQARDKAARKIQIAARNYIAKKGREKK